MSEQPDDANRRVVKKVVKKTVIRPVAPTVPRKAGAPVARSGDSATPRTTRLTTPARAQAARSATPVAPVPVEPVETRAAPTPTASPVRRPAGAPPSTPAAPVETTTVGPVDPVVTETATRAAAVPEPEVAPGSTFRTRPPKENQPKAKKAPKEKPEKQPRRRPSIPTISLPSLPRPDVRGRAADLGHGVADGVRGVFAAIGHRIAAAWHWLVGLRLPHLSPLRGSAVTGVLVGLMAVAIGWGFYELFSATLGTQAGGGWGLLAFVFLSFVVFLVGELLLAGFGIPHSRIISILAVLLVLLLILVFFLNLAAGVWAWLLVPTLCALMFMVASFTVITVSQEKNDQRLPWEPTDQSQVNTD